jgi:glycosyltransferase involved in cell wall biosynthesis
VSSQGRGAHAGGAESVLTALSVGLLGRGHSVELLQAFPDGVSALPGTRRTILHESDWHESQMRRVKNHVGDVLSLPRRRLDRIVASAGPDVVHTHNLPGVGTGIWEIARRRGIPVVHTAHDYHLLCPRVTLARRNGEPCEPSPLLCGLRTRALARWAGAVSHLTGVSQYVVDLHRPLFPGAELHVIRNPFTADVAVSRSPGPAPKVMGYIGSLDANKGVDRLLEAAPRLAAQGCSVRIAGDGRLRAEVEAAAADPASGVTYDGQVSDGAKSEFLAGCDLGVVPSVWAEPGGPNRTMIEWLSAQRPVLISRRGGLGEVAGLYPGSIAIEPTAEGIVAAVEALLEPGAWETALARASTVTTGTEDALARWVDSYEQVLEAARAGLPREAR